MTTQQEARGTFVQVTLKQAESLNNIGFEVLQDAFKGPGQHKRYWVCADDLPERVLAKIQGPISRTQNPRISADSYIQYTGAHAEFAAGSARDILFRIVREKAKNALQRWELETIMADGTPVTSDTINATVSYFIHEAGLLRVVE